MVQQQAVTFPGIGDTSLLRFPHIPAMIRTTLAANSIARAICEAVDFTEFMSDSAQPLGVRSGFSRIQTGANALRLIESAASVSRWQECRFCREFWFLENSIRMHREHMSQPVG